MAAAGLCRLLLAVVFVVLAQARFLVEQGGLKVRELEPWPSGHALLRPLLARSARPLQISFPPDAKTKYASGFDMALANFGAPKYGGALM